MCTCKSDSRYRVLSTFPTEAYTHVISDTFLCSRASQFKGLAKSFSESSAHGAALNQQTQDVHCLGDYSCCRWSKEGRASTFKITTGEGHCVTCGGLRSCQVRLLPLHSKFCRPMFFFWSRQQNNRSTGQTSANLHLNARLCSQICSQASGNSRSHPTLT